ncbi:MAG: D-amino acid dehydrogenase [Parvibaculaceae bacterium]|nr:D-amino acid dehydrogenase [Parvibaculaceae bacterium]
MTKEHKMRAVVIGAGVVGVTTAWRLREEGHDVTVIDASSAAASLTSHANGGQLGASEVTPWAGPGLILQALKWMGQYDAPFRLRLTGSVRQLRWLWKFSKRCTQEARIERISPNLKLALRSQSEMHRLLAQFEAEGSPIEFAHKRAGILRIFPTTKALTEAMETMPLMEAEGVEQQRLSSAECAVLEPALGAAHQKGEIAGGLFAPGDESGDAFLFTRTLAAHAAAQGVAFQFDEKVTRLETKAGRIVKVHTDRTIYEPDVVVLAAGVASPNLGKVIGKWLPVWPVKGYSVTLEANPAALGIPNVSITDEARRIVVSRFGTTLRAAGQAEVGGYDLTLDEKRGEGVLDALTATFPAAGTLGKPEYWCGLRPMTPDGSPILGSVPKIENLYLNTGHGTLGWTLALGSADLIAREISADKNVTMLSAQERAELAEFSLNRF